MYEHFGHVLYTLSVIKQTKESKNYFHTGDLWTSVQGPSTRKKFENHCLTDFVIIVTATTISYLISEMFWLQELYWMLSN